MIFGCGSYTSPMSTSRSLSGHHTTYLQMQLQRIELAFGYDRVTSSQQLVASPNVSPLFL